MYTSSSQSIQFTHSLTILSPQRGILLRVNPSSIDQSIEPVSFLPSVGAPPPKHSRPVYTPVWIISFSPSVGAPPPKTQSTSLYSSLDHLVLTFSWSPSSTSQFIPFSVSTPPPLTLATIIPVPHLLDKNPSNCSQQHHGDCFHFILFVFHLYFWYHTFLATTLTLTFLKHTYRDYVAFDKTT